ncbi:MAG: metallophosphoesterase family protein [Proteobacteria bacterium]|nr:metallophosphoesterase family protein [Pseudomonadota bacterium]
MRYVLISDLHSNLEALEATFERIDMLGLTEIVCLGDIVGYNTNPNECIDLLRARKVRSIMGNHDSRVAGLDNSDDFNYQALEALDWTRDNLMSENLEYLKALPRTLNVDGRFFIFHGWVNDTDSYIFGANDALKNFKHLDGKTDSNLCFFGHTHVAISYLGSDGTVKISADSSLRLTNRYNYLVNPGSVGQPRDRDPRAAFAVYDSAAGSIEFHRVEYDIKKTVDKILAVGLSKRIGERLKLGW